LFLICCVVWHNTIQIEGEKRKLQHIFGWTGRPGTATPAIVWYKTGVVISGPSGEVKVSISKFTLNYKLHLLWQDNVHVWRISYLRCYHLFCTATNFCTYIKSVRKLNARENICTPRETEIIENYMLRNFMLCMPCPTFFFVTFL
jgi:hypothetical protein